MSSLPPPPHSLPFSGIFLISQKGERTFLKKKIIERTECCPFINRTNKVTLRNILGNLDFSVCEPTVIKTSRSTSVKLLP